MFTWLVKIILGNGDIHRHQWETINTYEITRISDIGNNRRLCWIYVQRCTVCGKMSNYEVTT